MFLTLGSHLAPHPWGFCMFSPSLSFQGTNQKAFPARKISLTSEYTSYLFSATWETAGTRMYKKISYSKCLSPLCKIVKMQSVFLLKMSNFERRKMKQCYPIFQNAGASCSVINSDVWFGTQHVKKYPSYSISCFFNELGPSSWLWLVMLSKVSIFTCCKVCNVLTAYCTVPIVQIS